MPRNLERHKVSFARGSRALAEERKVRDLIVLNDPAGNRLEIFHGAETTTEPFKPGRAMSGFRTGPLGMGHAVLHCEKIDDIAAVLPRHAGLPSQRLFPQAVRGVFLPRQSAPPQRRLHRIRQGRHPSPDGRDLLPRRRRPVLRPRAAEARGDDRHHVRPALQRPGALVLFVVAVEVHVRIRLGRPHHRHRELDAGGDHPGPEPVGPRALLAERSSSATRRASFASATPRRATGCRST